MMFSKVRRLKRFSQGISRSEMKKGIILVFLVMFLGVGNGFCSKEISIPIFERPPKIDGVLNETCWKKAIVFEVDTAVPKKQLKDKWKAYIGCDTSSIYIGIDADVSEPKEILKSIKVRDDSVWRNDCFEIMVDYKNDGKTYAHLLMDTNSVRCDLIQIPGSGVVDFKNFDGDWIGFCQIKGNKIFVEFQIPYAIFDLCGKKDQDFRINICRENKYQGEDSSITGTFHEIDKFFVLKNLPIPKLMKEIEVKDVNWGTNFGQNVLTAKVVNFSEKDIPYRVVVIDRAGLLKDIKKEGILKKGDTEDIRKEYVIDEPTGMREITLSFADSKTGIVLRKINKVFSLIPAISAYTNKYLYDEDDEKMAIKIRLNLSKEILEKAVLKVFLKNGKQLLWQKTNPEQELYAVIDIKKLPFGTGNVLVVVEHKKMKMSTQTYLRKGKSPFYQEGL